ncbi:uncharacterized protein LOC126772373 [Nymphalis io]|uniref:uncharacterized protein LOC126772373 n=1 Tax=Inachis io TaxID=171585 RepID=UPI0021698A18|nr:uncharacterized protein LOC126772373 [Nymphalis io]
MALKSVFEINKRNNKRKGNIKSNKSKIVLSNNNNIINSRKVNERAILSDLASFEVRKQKKVKHRINNLPYSECKYLMASTAPMATYYNSYQIPQTYNFPVVVNEWSPSVSTVQVRNIFTSPVQHIPVAIITPQLIRPICPYAGALITANPVLSSVVQYPAICTSLCSQKYKTEVNYVQESMTTASEVFNNQDKYSAKESTLPEHIAEEIIYESKTIDPVELYLTLPKELFPTARMLAIDPNPIIDEFCKIATINENVSWILDLEFGVPRRPITRAIAIYDVKFNSIHCKNTPNAIHPGFEKCNSDFKRVILFYYDCIVSNWYKGYIILNYDKSVENFQSWLLLPMQMFGMCWS